MEAQRQSLENWKGRSRISKQGSYTQGESHVSQEGRRVWKEGEGFFLSDTDSISNANLWV